MYFNFGNTWSLCVGGTNNGVAMKSIFIGWICVNIYMMNMLDIEI